VVVSQPENGHGGVVQYDMGKATPGEFKSTGFLNTPPGILLSAIGMVEVNRYKESGNHLKQYLSQITEKERYRRGAVGEDILFEAGYDHEGGISCASCFQNKRVVRQPRSNGEVMVHYGTIASGNTVMKDAKERDKISSAFGGILCFEMEAAGLMNTFPCLVIRGIYDGGSHMQLPRLQHMRR
jgi:hypothetical protein